MSGNSAISIASIIIFVMLVIYIILGSYMEKKKVILGHETGVAIVIGFIISLGVKYLGDSSMEGSFNFDSNIFFYFCLPPIIFAAGFNMRRKRFFDNIGYIMLFGLLGTIITFIVFSALTFAFF